MGLIFLILLEACRYTIERSVRGDDGNVPRN